MLCKEIIEIIEGAYPRTMAQDWDNVGLLTGSREKEVRRIYVALDALDEVIEAAAECGADLLVTHHPMIFSPLRRVTEDDFTGKRVIRLIQKNIACYAMHTNYDVMGMAELSSQRMGMKNSQVLEPVRAEAGSGSEQGIGRVADLEAPVSLKEYSMLVKNRFSLETVKVFGSMEKSIKRAAISPGAGKSMVKAALEKRADVLITGDIDHHTGIDAVAQGLAVIDAGHYGLEHIFVRDIAGFLEKNCPGIEVTEDPVRHPFQVL